MSDCQASYSTSGNGFVKVRQPQTFVALMDYITYVKQTGQQKILMWIVSIAKKKDLIQTEEYI